MQVGMAVPSRPPNTAGTESQPHPPPSYSVERAAARRQIGQRQMAAPHEQYLQKSAGSPLIKAKPHPGLRMVVVIPCHDEPDLLGALKHLAKCEPSLGQAEVIVVINDSKKDGSAVIRQNLCTLCETTDWLDERRDPWLPIHLLYPPKLPPKHAGVGQARKIGMDEALRRLADVGQAEDGLLVCYDADCRCSPNYFTGIESHFASEPDAPGCSIHFEHPLDAGEWAALGFGGRAPRRAVFDGIAAYELHLRYHVSAQKFIGFPYGFHTIGSAMAVRAWAYVKQGGMNRRQAGEDFYFLQKISWLGQVTELTGVTVHPSPRLSERVPFGTGKAIGDYVANGRLATYPLQAYRDALWLLGQVEALWETGRPSGAAPEAMARFLRDDFVGTVVPEIRSNSSDLGAFRKRFFRWFNAFRLMKFLNFARDEIHGTTKVEVAATKLLEWLGQPRPDSDSAVELLRQFRRLEKGN
jgi:glycosyltransferase involved in cell wall biosynthesis